MVGFDIECARKALTDPRALIDAFSWSSTKQGSTFWVTEYHSETLSPKAHEILEKMIAEHTPVTKETPTMFEPGKEYKTRDGHKVRIYATDAGGTYPIHGAIFEKTAWSIYTWAACGHLFCNLSESDSDIMPPEPEKVTIWVNVYPYSRGGNFDTREDADRNALPSRIACVPLTYFKGEGLK